MSRTEPRCTDRGWATDGEILLKPNPDSARATTRDGMAAWHGAAVAGHCDVIAILRRHDSDVNAPDDRGRTALMEACYPGPRKSKPAEEIINCCSTTPRIYRSVQGRASR
jgi:ankyrin repeat protein